MQKNADVFTTPLNVELLEDAILTVEDYVHELKVQIDHHTKAGLILLLYALGDNQNLDLILEAENSINQILTSVAA